MEGSRHVQERVPGSFSKVLQSHDYGFPGRNKVVSVKNRITVLQVQNASCQGSWRDNNAESERTAWTIRLIAAH